MQIHLQVTGCFHFTKYQSTAIALITCDFGSSQDSKTAVNEIANMIGNANLVFLTDFINIKIYDLK